jgi:hypothetical protein
VEPPKKLSGIFARISRLWRRLKPPPDRCMRIWCNTELSYLQQKSHEAAKR